MTGFNGCNSNQSEILKSLIEDIKTYRAAAVYLLNHQNEDETYQKIFLKYYKDLSTLSKVTQTFNNVNNMSTATAYCETDADDVCVEGAMAWTYLNSAEFHVCPSFFSNAMFGTISERHSEGSSIVLHELTHCHGTDDFAYGEQGVSTLGSAQASNNADTYRLFAMSSIYYLNEKGKGLSKRDDDFLSRSVDFRTEPFKDKVVIRPKENLVKRSGDDFLNESIDFRAEPFKDKVVVRPKENLVKRSGDDFLNESIDFRAEPFKDKVIERPKENLVKRSGDDFLNESIDFRAEPFKDKVVIRPKENLVKRSGDDFLNESIDFRAEPFKDKVIERPKENLVKRSGDDFLNESIDFRTEPFKDKVVVRPNPNQQ